MNRITHGHTHTHKSLRDDVMLVKVSTMKTYRKDKDGRELLG